MGSIDASVTAPPCGSLKNLMYESANYAPIVLSVDFEHNFTCLLLNALAAQAAAFACGCIGLVLDEARNS